MTTRALTLILSLTVATSAVVLGTGRALAQDRPTSIREAWVRLPLGARTETAAFAIVENQSAQKRAITGVSTASAEKGELHEMKRVGEMMQMSPVPRIDVPARGMVELKPGGLHVMLYGLKQPLKAGDSVTLTFTFDDGSKTVVSAAVRAAAGMNMNAR